MRGGPAGAPLPASSLCSEAQGTGHPSLLIRRPRAEARGFAGGMLSDSYPGSTTAPRCISGLCDHHVAACAFCMLQKYGHESGGVLYWPPQSLPRLCQTLSRLCQTLPRLCQTLPDSSKSLARVWQESGIVWQESGIVWQESGRSLARL